MEPFHESQKKQSVLWACFKKLWEKLWKSKWTPTDPNQPKTPQDCRDEWLNKCPWKDFW